MPERTYAEILEADLEAKERFIEENAWRVTIPPRLEEKYGKQTELSGKEKTAFNTGEN